VQENGIIREWHADEGWGVVDCPGAPGGCWVHFGAVVMAGYRELSPGQVVSVEHEPADQDGYRYRAVSARPEGTPDDLPDVPPGSERSAAYRSSLRLWFDA
jgi:CspA family cold shock protein